MNRWIAYVLALLLTMTACRSSSRLAVREPRRLPPPVASSLPSDVAEQPNAVAANNVDNQVTLAAYSEADSGGPSSLSGLSALTALSTAPAENSTSLSPAIVAPLHEAGPAEELPPLPHEPISLKDVTISVYASYPSLDAASRERQIAAGQQLAAMGKFDVNLVGDAMTQPLGYYKNYRYNAGVKQYEWSGGETFAGYRLGRGFYEPWYKERQTNDGGEFRAGFTQPFLRDRAIDERRAAVFQSRIDQVAADPLLQSEVIDTIRSASQAYWDWVASGQRVAIAKRVLGLATERQKGMQSRAQKGEIAGIELVDNERLIVSRQAKLIEAQLKLQQSAIQLSLFLRDPTGTPLLASDDQLPIDFPSLPQIDSQSEQELVAKALARRPELRLLALDQQRQEVEVQQASNLSLPGLDGVVYASQDVGAPYSPLRDKSPFELQAGLTLDVPLQRRAARGKLMEAQGKLAQIAAKQRLAEQSITAEVQSATAALHANSNAVAQARRNVELALQLADAERTKLSRGDSDVLTVNLREIATVDAELLLVEAEANYFKAAAQLHAAIAAELTSSMPASVEPQL